MSFIVLFSPSSFFQLIFTNSTSNIRVEDANKRMYEKKEINPLQMIILLFKHRKSIHFKWSFWFFLKNWETYVESLEDVQCLPKMEYEKKNT